MEKNEISESTIKRANYKELTALCKKLEVPFKNQSRESLIKLLIKSADLTDKSSANESKVSDKKFIASAIKSAYQKPNEKKKPSVKVKQTKSDKIRALADKGKTVLEIAKIMSDTHYSFIHSVTKKHLSIRKK